MSFAYLLVAFFFDVIYFFFFLKFQCIWKGEKNLLTIDFFT